MPFLLKHYRIYGIILTICQILFFSASMPAQEYDYDNPVRIIALPPVLKEISGMAALDAGTIACIQDNEGTVFMYDIVSQKITGKMHFKNVQDIEGIARTGGFLYALQAGGILYRIPWPGKDKAKVSRIETGITADECEGLCYDPKTGHLLISTKTGIMGNSKSLNAKKYIYGFDTGSNRLLADPYLAIGPSDIVKDARKHKIRLPKDKIRFIPSEIALEPDTGELYVLSGMEFLLYVFSPKGKLKQINRLNPALYPQAEGLCFLPDGRLVISSEGVNSTGSLMILKRKKP